MSAHVRKKIGFPHDLAAVSASRHAAMPAAQIDYATAAPTYRLLGFAASTVEYQLTIEADQHDVMRACETVWRALAGGRPWGPRPRLLDVVVNDETSNITLLRATAGLRGALRPEAIGLLGTAALALLWLVAGLLFAKDSVHDAIVIGASPPIIAGIVTLFITLFVGRRTLSWAASR